MSAVIPAAPATAATTDAAATAPVVDAVVTQPAATAPKADADKTVEELIAERDAFKGHSRTWEDRAKENKAAKEALDALEAEKLTEAQRLQKRIDDLVAENATTAAAALKSSVSAETGVPASLLYGTTKEELDASAAAALAFRGPIAPPANDAAASGNLGAQVGIAGAAITSRAQLEGMSAQDVVQAKADGRLKGLLGN